MAAKLPRIALALVAGCAVLPCHAGQIVASSLALAREVVTTDVQQTRVPTVSYRFNGDTDTRSQPQLLQLQYTLGGGAKWALPASFANDSFTLVDGLLGTAITQGAPIDGQTTFQILARGLSADSTTLWVTYQVSGGLVRQPIFSTGASSTASHNAVVTTLKTVSGTLGACETSAAPSVTASVKHYVGLSAPNAQASNANAFEDESARYNAQNTTPLITLPTNIVVGINAATGGQLLIDAAAQSKRFAGTNSTGGNTWGTAGVSWQPYISPTLAVLGQIALTQNAQGNDLDLTSPYLLTGNPAGSGIAGHASATSISGSVEASALTVKVSAPQGFAPGATLFLAKLPTCTAAATIINSSVAITSANAAGPITLNIDTLHLPNAMGTLGTGPLAVCYNVAGATSAIPGLSFNVEEARLVKAVAGTYPAEQDNFCAGPIGLPAEVSHPAADVPLPPWALVGMAGALLGLALRKKTV